MVRNAIKIGLLNHMGGGNLGDDATQQAVIQKIRSRWPNTEIFGFSMNPSDTQARHGIRSYPIRTETWMRYERPMSDAVTVKMKVSTALRKYRFIFAFLKAIETLVIRLPRRLFQELRFLAKSFQIIRSLDLMVVSGGGQLLDAWGGPWKFPYTVFKWTLLTKLSKAQCYFLNVGAGPLDHALGRWFVKNSLRLADYVSFRDEDSRALVQSVGYAGKCEVSPDCVYALDPCVAEVKSGAEEPMVGLAPMAYCDPRVYWQKDQTVYDGFVGNLASFGGWLGQNHYRLALFSTDILFDAQTIEDVKVALGASNGHLVSHLMNNQPIKGIDELLSQMNSMDYIITCRFHGVVFAHLLNKPVLALSHHPKVATLMSQMGLAKYCVDIRKCDVNVMKETFLALVENRDEIRNRMADSLACYKKGLSQQFVRLFPESART